MSDTILVLGILILCIPVPLLIIFHYISKFKRSRELTGSDERMMEDLWKLAQTMEERVETLETILDETDKDWRKKL